MVEFIGPSQPVWQQDPAGHLALVERALALAKKMPRLPVLEPVVLDDFAPDQESIKRARETGQAALGASFEELRVFLSGEGGTLSGIFGEYMKRSPQPPKIGLPWVLMVEWWGATTRHRLVLKELIAALAQLREAILDRKRWLSDESDAELIRRVASTADLGGLARTWSELNPTEQDILRVLSPAKLAQKQLPSRVSKTLSMVNKALARLLEEGFVRKVPGGYIVVALPKGHPSDVWITDDPPRGQSEAVE